MSKIEAPQAQGYSNYSTNPFGGARYNDARLHVGGTYGDDSFGYGSFSNEVQGYIQYMHRYQQMLLAYRSTHRDPKSLAIVDQYLAQSNEYLQMVGDTGWDPMSGNVYGDTEGSYSGDDFSNGNARPNGNPAPDYVDNTKQIYGESEEISRFQADKDIAQNEIHFYNYGEMTFEVPGAAKAKVTYDATSGATKAELTWPTGKTQTYLFHNNKKVIFAASDPERQVTLDASVPADKVAKGGIDSTETGTKLQGDQPITRQDGKKGYDGKSAEIYGGGKDKELWVSLREEAHFHASSNTEFWTVEWDEKNKQYLIKVYGDSEHKNLLNTYHMDDMTDLKATFDIDPSHIEFKGSLGTGEGGHEINTDNPHGAKLSLDNKVDDSQSAADSSGDTPPDAGSVKGGKATYSESSDVDLHADFEDKKIKDSIIIAPGKFTLHVNYKDNILITRAGEKPDYIYTITVSKDGKGPLKTYTIKGPPSKILIDALPANITYDLKGEDKRVQIGNTPPAEPGTVKAGQIVTNIPSGGHNTDEALSLAQELEEAYRTGNWDQFRKDMQDGSIRGVPVIGESMEEAQGKLNNIMRKLITGLFKAAGSDREKFMDLLKLIPGDVRKEMKTLILLRSDEMGETQTGDQWNSAATASMIDASFEEVAE